MTSLTETSVEPDDWSLDTLGLDFSLDSAPDLSPLDAGSDQVMGSASSASADDALDPAVLSSTDAAVAGPPELTAISLSGSVETGFAIAIPDAGDELPLSRSLAEIPAAAEAPDLFSVPNPDQPGSSLSTSATSQLLVMGSDHEGFELQGEVDAALDMAIAELNLTAAQSTAPERPTPVLGFPEARMWPDSDTTQGSTVGAIAELFDVTGSASDGFAVIAADEETAADPVLNAINTLETAAAMDTPQANIDADTLADLQRSLGRYSADAIAESTFIATTVFPFATAAADLSMLPAATDPDPQPAASTIEEPSPPIEPAVSALALTGSAPDGYWLSSLDDATITQVVQQLESFAELPASTDGDQVETELIGQLGRDRQVPEPTSSVPISTEGLTPPSLLVSGTAEAGYTIDETDEPPLIEDLAEQRLGLSESMTTTTVESRGFWTTELEEQMAADFAAATDFDDEEAELGPLSEDEFVDFFPPSEASATAPSETATVDDLNTAIPLEPDTIDALIVDGFGSDTPPDEEDIEVADALATLMDESPQSEVPPSAPADEMIDEFADLFTPEELATAEMSMVSPSDEASSLESDQFEEADDRMTNMGTSSETDNTELVAEDPPETTLMVDLPMEDIPVTEIENDEIFRSAFDLDSSFEDVDDTNKALPDFTRNVEDTADSQSREVEEAIAPASSDSLDDYDPVARDVPPPETDESMTDPATVSPDATADDTEEAAMQFASSSQLALIPEDEPEEPDQDPAASADESAEEWFLGIDIGTTGISAVLMEHFSGTAHPLCWSALPDAMPNEVPTFRLPARVSLEVSAEGLSPQLAISREGLAAQPQTIADADEYLLDRLRPLLRVGLSHQTTAGTWEPLIQWTEDQVVSLHQILSGVRSLVMWLRDPQDGMHQVEAVGLDNEQLHDCLAILQGVVVGMPTNWSDTYCMNVRECILGAALVESPGQIFFVEEAIAAVLSGLPDPGDPVPEPSRQTQTLYQCQWQGGTVVINSGAVCTEVGMVDMPQPLDALSREDFKLRNLSYGGDALDLDIICQLLLPVERRQPRKSGDRRSARDGWSWQATLPEVANAQWSSLQLDTLDLPQLAEPDTSTRIRLRQHLESSQLGQSLLEAARYLKLILQHQNQYQLDLADQSWRVLRRDLESRVLVPYIQRINQQLNALLSQSGLASQGINQVICTGGNASFNTIAKWLRQKFPNATIIQDTYPTNRPQTCSRVAYGLVNLCRYPQVLDVSRHQYSDYFLLHEMLRAIPEAPLPLDGILHILEERGIHTDVCRSRIEAILEGHLPPGLVPDAATRDHLSRATVDSDAYRDLTAASLFTKQTRQIYMINVRQRDIISNHLAAIMLNKQQALTEPMIVQLVTP